jgi:acyl carrier protein
MSDDFESRVIGVIATTFSVPASAISRATTADDVDGWDSLGHSILMTRLSHHLAMEIGEDIASGPDNVGELVDALARERSRIG